MGRIGVGESKGKAKERKKERQASLTKLRFVPGNRASEAVLKNEKMTISNRLDRTLELVVYLLVL